MAEKAPDQFRLTGFLPQDGQSLAMWTRTSHVIYPILVRELPGYRISRYFPLEYMNDEGGIIANDVTPYI